ncbi:MAG: pyridoxamine 5'-phosphate oxidase family protein [Hyphomicrobiaceae bacterium]
MHSNWPLDSSPFHAGEQQVQERLGVRDKIENFARRVVRDHMPDQHRDFYQQLPFVVLGTVDDAGRSWSSIVTGAPGFMTTPDARTLAISASPLSGDPLAGQLKPGAFVGVLGLEPGTRRRNRMSGTFDTITESGFHILVKQAFGNCPQYIQSRTVGMKDSQSAPAIGNTVTHSPTLDARSQKLISQADTLFIATAYATNSAHPAHGADVSHRGGKPGFVRVEDDRTFVFPDFAGNNHFNTVGNLALNPKAGFLFVDFERGDLLYLTGQAAIVWDGPEVQAFEGAERFIRFELDEAIYVVESLPLTFTLGDYSPVLSKTGSWEQTSAAVSTSAERIAYVDYEIFDVVQESDIISSFYLRRVDGKKLPDYEPGQFLPISLSLPGHDQPVRRTYTLSDAPNGDYYRLSVKREGGNALASNYLHDHAGSGFRLKAMAPRGKFSLDQSTSRPVVFISAGVGITPMIAMTNALVAQDIRISSSRKVFFIHAALSGRTHAFNTHLRGLEDQYDDLTVHVRYSAPDKSDEVGVTHDSEGLIDKQLLSETLPLDDYDIYLCGPPPFMQSMLNSLVELGVREERIRYESFGPATVLKPDAQDAGAVENTRAPKDPVTVRFADSDLDTIWTPESGTLLELAEAAGLNPTSSCRSGVCGSCATKLACGAIDYLEEPSAEIGEGDVLLCCAVPASRDAAKSCGPSSGIVLDL